MSVKQTLCSLYWNQNKFLKPEQREDNSLKLPMGRMSLAMNWRSSSFSIENSGKQKSKNTLRVEINQFCDG